MPTTTAPLGSPFALGIPATASEPATATELSRYIDPNNGTYRIDASSGVYGTMPATRQRVLLALMTLRGSSTVLPDFGLIMPRKLGPSTLAQVQDAVRRALSHLTGVITIDAIELKRTHPGRGEVNVSFTDITSGERDEVTV